MSDDRPVTDIDDAAERHFAALARTVTPEDRQRVSPPADLWDAIADTLGDDLGATAGVEPPGVDPGPSGIGRLDGPTLAVAPPAASDAGSASVVVPLRRRMSTVAMSAAAALIVAVGAVALVLSGTGTGDSGELVAAGSLDALADGFEGGVELVDVDGRLALDVDVAGLTEASDAYYELWLIKDLETGEMQSLGPIEGSGRVDIPEGLDPGEYPVVDISVEPLDGVPTHSGDSILRGELDI